MKNRSLLFRCTVISLFVLAVGARAQGQASLGFRGWGLRAGVSIDPDQFHFGAHVNAGQFAPRVRFQPSFELGLGNDRTVGAINLDALYQIRARGWQPYLGGGLGIALIDVDSPHRRGDDFNAEAGLNLVAGFEWGTQRFFLLEIRAGVGDIPGLKITAGLGF